MGLAFIPIIVQVWTRMGGDLYPWTNKAAIALDPVLAHHVNIGWTPLWFTVRAVIYFLV